jgi:hypothetical protein
MKEDKTIHSEAWDSVRHAGSINEWPKKGEVRGGWRKIA